MWLPARLGGRAVTEAVAEVQAALAAGQLAVRVVVAHGVGVDVRDARRVDGGVAVDRVGEGRPAGATVEGVRAVVYRSHTQSVRNTLEITSRGDDGPGGCV